MSVVDETIEVNVPVRTAYDQWTQFESFPEFMEGVEEVRQVTDTRTHWRTKIGGVEREFDAEITEQVPDQRIAWRAVDGPDQGGVVTFDAPDPDKTRILLELDYDPEGAIEEAGDKLGVVKRRVKGDLERFKDFIESRGVETGAWRGEVR
ncbi:MAG TPA: SRPBCC family protein [Acidimicrobiales bacterium]|nr:SRPBCC family protein [Acidimicrobiales bacterium]